MKNKKTFIIDLKDIKSRVHFAPKQRSFKNKKKYNRNSFKLEEA